ncbi:MAG: TetR/AcrR family transcriptional regulator C-terminal domain-containing protein [Actinomycetales bacterium]
MPEGQSSRPRLSRERILAEAIASADENGIDALTIRALASRLGAKPMSLYHHVDSKESLLDAMVDEVFDRIDVPDPSLPWREAVRRRCLSARAVLASHAWSVPLLESRRHPGPATLRHHDAMLGCLLGGGLSMQLTAHAYAVLDSYVYGFAIQEANLPVGGEDSPATVAEIAQAIAIDDYPHLARFTIEHAMRPDYRFGDSFEYGLDVLLDGIAASAVE